MAVADVFTRVCIDGDFTTYTIPTANVKLNNA